MKHIKILLIVAIAITTVLFSAGCTQSAYDVAVKNGYEGTEQQWLVSLKGKDGTDGKDLNITDIYAKAVDEGFEGSYLEFLHEYLSFTEAPDNSTAVTRAMRSVVYIESAFSTASSIYQTGRKFAYAGAGVIYRLNQNTSSAYIITNYHVVYSGDANTSDKISNDIHITPYGGSPIAAQYIGGSARYDIAVLLAQNAYFATDFPIAVSVNKGDVSVGQTVIAIGNPEGQGISATQGIVSVDSEYIEMESIDGSASSVSSRVMRIDAAVNSGNSGGGLFNASGEFIGVVNAKASDSSIENIGYAIPALIATGVADNIIRNTVFTRGTLGISVGARDTKAYIGDDGMIKISQSVYVASVSGASVGKLQTDDVILSVKLGDEEIAVTRQFHVTDIMLSSAPGDTVTFKVLRGGSEVSVDITCA